MIDILNALNKEQKEAVLHNNSPLLVLAGAGTGKTKVLISKIAYLLESGLAYPSEILAVTFTNKASREMHERVVGAVGSDVSALWLGTFHSVGNKILRRHAELVGLTSDFTIIDTDDQNKLIKQIMTEVNVDAKEYPAKNYVNKINEWKDRGFTSVNVGGFSDFYNYPEIKEIYKIYTDRCKKLNICDFGDLLLLNVELFKNHEDILNTYRSRFKYILVDEYQDTNAIQHTWLKMISGVGVKSTINICCVGDDDQSIYGWRGAEVENILKFEKDYKNTKIVRLERNYRSTGNILSVASCVIANNNNRHKKTLWTEDKSGGDKVCLNCFDRDKEEAYSIAGEIIESIKDIDYKDIAVLVRAGYQTRIFEEIFMSQNIPYKIVGGFKFYDRKEIKDIISYLKLIKNHSDFLAFERIINVPRRGIGSVTIGKIMEEVRGTKTNIIDACEDMCLFGSLKGKTAENVMEFIVKIREWSAQLTMKDHISLTKDIIYASGYMDSLIAEKTDEANSAIENLHEFIRGLGEFSNLSEFLEYISLVNDKTNGSDVNSVNLMTIHSAKGLEFDTVFLPGWEEGIFPSPRSIDEKNGLEEERRLAYVAITRAKNKLFISYAKTRYEYGEVRSMRPSRFISELPENNLKINDNYYFDSNNDETMKYVESKSKSWNFFKKPKVEIESKDEVKAVPSMNLVKKVVHPTFGEGMVIKKDGKKLTIIFKSVGSKTILESFIKYVE